MTTRLKDDIQMALDALELAHPRAGITTHKHIEAIATLRIRLANWPEDGLGWALGENDAEIEHLRAELNADALENAWAERNEAVEELAEVKKYWAEAHAKFATCHVREAKLEAERDAAIKEVAKWAREAGASQAREAKLREALEGLVSWVYASAHWGCTPLKVIYAQAVLALPTDDSALKEAIKQAKREALLEAAEHMSRRGWRAAEIVNELRCRAEEIAK